MDDDPESRIKLHEANSEG